MKKSSQRKFKEFIAKCFNFIANANRCTVNKHGERHWRSPELLIRLVLSNAWTRDKKINHSTRPKNKSTFSVNLQRGYLTETNQIPWNAIILCRIWVSNLISHPTYIECRNLCPFRFQYCLTLYKCCNSWRKQFWFALLRYMYVKRLTQHIDYIFYDDLLWSFYFIFIFVLLKVLSWHLFLPLLDFEEPNRFFSGIFGHLQLFRELERKLKTFYSLGRCT